MKTIDDLVLVRAPGSEHNGQIGIVTEKRVRRFVGNTRYTVRTTHGEVYLNEGQLRDAPTDRADLCDCRDPTCLQHYNEACPNPAGTRAVFGRACHRCAGRAAHRPRR